MALRTQRWNDGGIAFEETRELVARISTKKLQQIVREYLIAQKVGFSHRMEIRLDMGGQDGVEAVVSEALPQGAHTPFIGDGLDEAEQTLDRLRDEISKEARS